MEYGKAEENQGVFNDNSFAVRLAVSITLFVLVVFFDMTESTFLGIAPENIYRAVAFDFGQVMELLVTVVVTNK